MPFFGYRLKTWDGHNINDGAVYSADLITEDGGTLDTLDAQSIESERPGSPPVFVRMQPNGRRFAVEVTLETPTAANLDRLKQWFDPTVDEERVLVATRDYGDGLDVQMLCVVERVVLAQIGGNTPTTIYRVNMRSAIGIWESVEETETPTTTVTDGGGTDGIDIVALGSAISYPTFVLTPQSLQSNTEGFVKRRRILSVNRSEMPLFSDVGGGYPIRVCSLDDLGITPGNDVHLMHNGVDLPLWIDGDNNVWANIEFAPRRTFVLADALDNNDVGVVSASNADGLLGWPSDGFFLLGSECIRYTDTGLGVITISERGALNTTAASHLADTTAYWLEHEELYLIWDYAFAQAPTSPTDRKPIFDLDNSSNEHWTWQNGVVFNDNDLRSGTWRREYAEDNPAARYIRSFATGSGMFFENAKPATQKILANNAILEAPCGLSRSTGALILTELDTGEVPVSGYSWRKRVVRTDYTYERFGLGEFYVYETSPTSTSSAERMELQQTGQTETEIENTFPNDRGPDSEHTSYTQLWTGNYEEQGQDNGINTFYGVHINQMVPSSTTRTTYTQEQGTIDEVPMDLTPYGVDIDGYEGVLTLNAALAVPIFRVRLNAEIPVGVDLNGDSFQEPPAEVKAGTNANIRITGLTVHFDEDRIPQIVVCAEEDMYLLVARLENDETGEYLDIAMNLLEDQDITIDCAAHTVTDEDGREYPFAVVASDPKHWLYNLPNQTNNYLFTMAGISGGDGEIDISATHKDRWL